MQDLSSDAASQMFSLDIRRSTVGTTPLLELTSEMRDLPVVQTRLGVESLQQLVVEAVAVKHLVQCGSTPDMRETCPGARPTC